MFGIFGHFCSLNRWIFLLIKAVDTTKMLYSLGFTNSGFEIKTFILQRVDTGLCIPNVAKIWAHLISNNADGCHMNNASFLVFQGFSCQPPVDVCAAAWIDFFFWQNLFFLIWMHAKLQFVFLSLWSLHVSHKPFSISFSAVALNPSHTVVVHYTVECCL